MVLLFSSIFFLVIKASLSVYSDGFQQFYTNRPINPLISYGDVTLFRYTIPHEIVSAKWHILPSISSNSCESREVVFVIRWQGYPLVSLNPLNEPTRARDDLLLDTSEQYEVMMKSSDSKSTTFSVNNPLPGIWLAFAYSLPPKYHRRIKGEMNLFEECRVNLSTHLSLERLEHGQRPITLLVDDPSPSRTIRRKQLYKFYAPMDIDSVQMILNCSETNQISQSNPLNQSYFSHINHSTCLFDVFLRRQALPSSEKYDNYLDCSLAKEQENGCTVRDIYVTRNNWNYLLIVRKNSESKPESDQLSLNVSITLNLTKCDFPPIHSSSLSSLISAPFENLDQHINSNSIDDLDSQQDPTIFSSFIKREAGTSDLRFNNIMKFGKAPKLTEEKPSSSENNAQQCPLSVNLVRNYYQGPFSFEYEYIHSIEEENWNRTSGSEYFDIQSDMHKGLDQLENISSSTKISVLSFHIVPLMDSGGSLTLNLTIKQGSNYSNVNNNNVSVEACINYDHYSHQTDRCLHKVAVNSSHLYENSVRIPYPRAGHWFVTFKSDCYHVVGSERLQYIPSGCKQNTTAIQFSIKSYTCSDQDCGKHGKCSVSVQDGLSFSTCSCSSGWKGIDCGDDSSALDEKEILLQFLLLTLSNVVFIPVLILALYRKLFTEAFLYLVVMTSSILHHACDSDSEHSFCVIKSDLLRYIDHYSMLLAFWVTLITLTNLPQKVQTFLHLVGSFCLAVAVEVDGASLKTLLIPVILGFTIVTLTWFLFCVTKKSCFPSYQLWLLSMIPGLVLTATGLIAHCLFETKEYYPVVHSFWHVLMASALLFLIPTTEKEVKADEEEDYRLKGKMYLLVSSYESRTDGPTYVTTRDANIIQKLRALRIIEEPLKFTNYNCYNYKFEYPDICVLDWFQLLGYRVQTMAMTYDPDVSCIKHIWTMYV